MEERGPGDVGSPPLRVLVSLFSVHVSCSLVHVSNDELQRLCWLCAQVSEGEWWSLKCPWLYVLGF